MRISDNRYQRDHMRLDLALRFLGHGARTHTIRAWTMLSDDRIRKLYRSYVYTVDDAPRHRGKSPQQAAFFMRGARAARDRDSCQFLCTARRGADRQARGCEPGAAVPCAR